MSKSFIFHHECWLTQVGYRSRGCCSSTQTLWGRLCLVATQRPTTIQRSTSAIIQASPWAAGGCASMHLVLLFTQVSKSVTIQFEHTQRLFRIHSTFFFSSCSHPWEAGGAVLIAFSVFFRLSGLWFGHRSGHSLHQPVRGAVSLRHLRRSLLFSLYAALLSALWILPEPAGEITN